MSNKTDSATNPMENNTDENEDIGYGKPPKHTRFATGKSGNPRGRPKGKKNFASYLQETLNAKVSIQDGSKARKVTTTEAALARLRVKALKGDPRALDKLLDLAERYGAEQDAREAYKTLSKEDQAIFEAYTDRIRQEAIGSQNPVMSEPISDVVNAEENDQ